LATSMGLVPVTSPCGPRGLALLRRVLAAGVAAGFHRPLSLTPADAATRKRQQGVAVKASKTREDSKGPFGDIPKGPLLVVVSIGQQHATSIATACGSRRRPVSTGTPGHPTPFGVFSVIEKDQLSTVRTSTTARRCTTCTA